MRYTKDLSIYNEATGFSLHSRGMGGLDRETLTNDLLRSVRDGLVVPVQLVQDDPLRVRVVLGDLLPAEEEEWVGRIVWKLRIPCGSLAVEGGLDPSTTDEDEYVQFVDVPPGDYLVEVLTYLHGINGSYCVADFMRRDPLGMWFRRSHPGAPFPTWIKMELAEEPGWDPGHEAEWNAFAESLDRMSVAEYDALVEADGDLIDFVVRLTPLGSEKPTLESHEDGWFMIDAGARKPTRCPLGIRSEPTE